MDIKKRAATGILWSALENGGSYGITFIVFAVLARLLESEDFGLVAMAMVYVAFVELVVKVGITEVIIQRQDLLEAHKDTAFWSTAVLGVMAYLASIGVAPYVGEWSGDSRLAELISWLALGILPVSLTRVQEGLLLRDMQFRKLAIRRLVATISGGIVGILLAVMGYGFWSLVAQQLVSRFVDFLVLYWVTTWYPCFRFSFSRLTEMLGFGGKIMGTNITQFINTQVDRLLIGHFLGMDTLGLYVVGRRIADVLFRMLVSVLNRVAFSAYARMQPAEQLSAFLLSTRKAAFISLPMFALLSISADPVTIMVFGDKWEAAGTICRLVALSALVQSISTFAPPLLKVSGHPGKVFVSMIVRSLVSVGLAYLASPYGLLPMVAAWIAGELLSPMLLVYWLWMVRRISPVKLIGSIRFILLSASLAAVIAGWALMVLANNSRMITQLLYAVSVFIPVYLLMIRKLEPEEFRVVANWIRKLRKGGVDSASG